MPRTALLLLVAAYAAAVLRLSGVASQAAGLDPLAPQGRFVERAIAERRFAEALPVALTLQRAHHDDPLTALWLAAIYHGLDRPRDEALAWTSYVRLSATPADACPALPDAYERAGALADALDQYRECARLDPADPGIAGAVVRLAGQAASADQ